MARVWRNYGLGILFVAMFLVAWAIMTWAGWTNYIAEQHQHGQSADFFGTSGYIWKWGQDTFSNWQADFIWQGMAVVLGAYLIFRGSEQSKESDDHIDEMVTSIAGRLRGETPPSPLAQAQSRSSSIERVLRNYGLGIALVGFGVLSWVLMTWTGWQYFVSQQQEHHQIAQVFGTSGYLAYWANLTMENWQSDIFGHAAMVILPAYLIYKGSAESRDTSDDIEQKVEYIQQEVERMEREGLLKPESGNLVRETRPRSASVSQRS